MKVAEGITAKGCISLGAAPSVPGPDDCDGIFWLVLDSGVSLTSALESLGRSKNHDGALKRHTFLKIATIIYNSYNQLYNRL